MAATLVPLHAADRIYLRNGSDLICDHQKNVDGQVRLYLTASEENYLDVAAGDIVRRETVNILPVTVAVKAIAPAAAPTTVELATLLTAAGAAHHLDPDLLASVVRAESGGHISAVSRTGAQGLMQLMPSTAKDLGVADSFAPAENVAGGATYLDALLMYYHENLAVALAAYNAGPAAVNRYGGIPPYAETRRYVERVIHDYNRRKLQEARRHSRLLSQAEVVTIVAHP
jgi:soluble lytic murein transglycosylase-like protein